MDRTFKITLLIIGGLTWAAAGLGGMALLVHYSMTPSPLGQAPGLWPSTVLKPFPGRDTLVVAIHPRCPCTRASLTELNKLLPSLKQKVGVYLLVVRPEGVPPGWEDTDLLASAKRIPGAVVRVDEGGAEASRFGAQTSGQAMLFDPQGKLLFNGGLTGSRGHEGANDGTRRIRSLVDTGKADRSTSPVFGCGLGATFCPRDKAAPRGRSNV